MLRDSAFVKGLKSASRMLRDFGRNAMQLGAGMMAAGTAILTPILAAVRHFIKTGDALGDMAARTKVAATVLAELSYAASTVNVEMDDVEKALIATALAVQKLREGSKESVDMFRQLGLSAQSFVGLNVAEQFALISKKLAGLKSQNARLDLAKAIFGKQGAALLPMTDQLEKLREDARRKGLIPSETAIKQAGDIDDAMNDLKKTFSALVFEVGSGFAPTVKELLSIVQQTLAATRKWVEEHRDLIGSVSKLGAGLIVAGAGFMAMGQGLIFTSNALKASATVFGIFGTVLASPLRLLGSARGMFASLTSGATKLTNSLVQMGVKAISALSGLSRIGGVAKQVASNFAKMAMGGGQIAIGFMQIGVSAGLSLVTGIANGVRSTGSTLGPILGNLMSRAWRGAMTNLPRELALLSTLSRAAVTALTPIWNRIGPPLRAAFLRAAIFAGPALTRLTAISRTVANSVVNAWRTVGPRIAAGLQVVVRKLNQIRLLGMSAARATGRAVAAGAGNIGRGLGGVASGVGGLLSMLGSGAGGLLGQIGMAIPSVLMLGGALASLLTPLGLIAAAVGIGAFAWLKYSESGQAAFAKITAILAPFVKTFQTTFGGIVDAIKAGDLGLAAQIAMAGLKVALLQGVAMIVQSVGGAFGDFIGTLATQITGGDFAGAWATAVAGMKAVFFEFAEGVIAVFTMVSRSIVSMWKDTVGQMTDAMLKSASEDGVMGNMMRKILGVDMREVQKQNAKLNAMAKQRGLAQSEDPVAAAQRDARRTVAGWAKPAEDKLNQIDADAQNRTDAAKNDLKNKTAGGAAAVNPALAAAQAELARLTAESERLRKEKEAADAANEPGGEGNAGLGDLGGSRRELLGSFSAASLAAQGSSPMQPVVNKLEQIRANGEKLIFEFQQGMMVA